MKIEEKPDQISEMRQHFKRIGTYKKIKRTVWNRKIQHLKLITHCMGLTADCTQ